MRFWFALFVTTSLPLLAQHEKDGDKPRHPFIGDPMAIEAGRKTFVAGCAVCHGAEGQGGRGPSLRQRVMWHPLEDETLYQAIQKGIGGAMPPANLSENDAWQVVAFVRALTSPAVETPLAVGNPANGESLFWGKTGCANCHRVRGRGGALGPDLTNVGGARALPQLLEAILDPDAEGAAAYRAADVLLKSGARIKGVVRNHTNYSLQIQDAAGNLHLLRTQDVSELGMSKSSPMPKNFRERLTKPEIDDLVAYLSRQTIRPVEPRVPKKAE